MALLLHQVNVKARDDAALGRFWAEALGRGVYSYADRLRRYQLPYGISSLASAAAHASLQDRSGLHRNIAANRQAYALLTSELDRLYLGYTRSEANFLLIDLGDQRDQVIALLRARGLRFRDGARWRPPAMLQVHLIDEATVAPLVRALRDLR